MKMKRKKLIMFLDNFNIRFVLFYLVEDNLINNNLYFLLIKVNNCWEKRGNLGMALSSLYSIELRIRLYEIFDSWYSTYLYIICFFYECLCACLIYSSEMHVIFIYMTPTYDLGNCLKRKKQRKKIISLQKNTRVARKRSTQKIKKK